MRRGECGVSAPYKILGVVTKTKGKLIPFKFV